MLQMLKIITLNDMPRFYKSLFWTSIAEIAKFSTIFVVIYFVARVLGPFFEGSLFYFGGVEASFSELLLICAVGFLLMIAGYYLSIPAYRANFESTYKASAKGRIELAEHIRKLPLGFLESANPSRLSHCIMKDFASIEQANSHLVPQVFGSFVVSVVVFVGLAIYHFQMALAFFACVPLAVVILWATRRLSDYLSARHIDAVLDASNHINEYIDGITTIKAHSLSGEKFKRLERSFENLRKESIKIEVGLMPFALAVVSCMGAGIGLMIGFGREFLLRGELSVIEYLGFILVGSKAFVPLMTFAINFIELRYFVKSGQNILALRAQKEVSGSDRQIPQGNDIVIENLCFSYGARGKSKGGDFENVQGNGKDKGVIKQDLDRQDFALRDINLLIPHKSSLAIVGESGSGKSTLVKLIARFYEPSSGAIKIGNANEKASLKNIAWLEIESLMGKFSMVFQNPYLFGGSLKSNVAFGKEDASDEEIREALKSANALEFVNALPYGIDTKVSESGASLSGGEKQRISIARCNLKNSPIILLDEITSSLDVYNEFAMQRALNRLAKDKTVIIIAHKLKSVMNCDKIVFLKNGKIVESGTHKQLLALKGEYAKMWSAQNLG
ncbi:ABC transporter ATP-binding protein [Helicobacter sp. MIT 01-3238]|uniref:ABC transporter ATP-binding protein n=1 Tax=Helicobacter sp. MIT 01-3238 TaxID=398627 RepID=UPI000E1F0D36|nr:ABC transporter ATP-binding protein [Helicobacter sp. MIT 01-3238]RDU54723.1 ABC transporter ATP-binding protein [Helicobacter sp. MIT 01-3238]